MPTGPSEELAERLRGVMAAATGEADVRVEGLSRLSGGASRETWAFDLVGPAGRERLILRRDPPGAPRAGGMGVEAAVVRAAGAAGVPVPRVVTASDDVGLIGSAFMVVERIDGETIPRRILRQADLAPARSRLAEQCGRILATIHSVRPGDVPGIERQDPLAQYRETLDQIGWPSPTFELAFRWLEQHRPLPADGTGARVVHGDFRNGNLIVGPDGVRAVLDWEMAHLGDPMEDLAWLCVKSWRFGVDLPVGGFGTYDQLIGAYEAAGGAPVDRDGLHWWEILGNLKWGVICMMQAWAHTSGAVRSVELAAIGRRVCETEWDLLDLLSSRLLPPAPAPPPDGGSDPVDMHGVPDAAGLVEAVREFLERDVMAATEGRIRFHTRVAVNVLGMVQRELALGPAQRATHAAGLAALGVGSEAELAGAIRAGRMDARRDEVMGLLRRTVRAKLEVAHPSYLEPPAPPAAPLHG